MNFQQFKELRYNPPVGSGLDRDIIEHLSLLEELASKCEHVTEFGIGKGHSISALLSGCKGKVVSYDINRREVVDELYTMELPCQWQFHQRDTGDSSLEIESTDFLFIDSFHEYSHCKQELELHPSKVRKYLGFHDTVTFGERGQDGLPRGIMPAIREFLSEHPEWVVKTDRQNNNGCMILERISDVASV